jgi:predicted patatin/cPLA2 family phospholipase
MRSNALAILGLTTVLSSMLILTGCALPRPDPGIACNLHSQSDRAPVRMSKSPRAAQNWDRLPAAEAQALRGQIRQSYESRLEPKRKLRGAGQRASYDVLVLSAGGQYGAYGSGFIKGWGERPDLRPDRAEIDMVTGVSTGAVMASHVYLGSSADAAIRSRYDDILKSQYTTLRNEDVLRKRLLIEYLWANSVYDSTPLHARIERLVTDDLLRAVVAESDNSGRLLFVGAVNADSGLFEYFDLVAIAKDTRHDQRKCYVAAVLASAAIPAIFNPVFINGQMYVDGGARQNAFFVAQIDAALPGVSKNLFGILHGDLAVPDSETKNGLISIVSRTSSIATDQLGVDAAYYVDSEAKRRGFVTRWTSAANTTCETVENDDMFSPSLGLCLWEAGYSRASSGPSPWKDFSQIRNP